MKPVHYFDCEGPNFLAISKGLQLAAERAAEGSNEITIFLPTLQQASGTVLTEVIGVDAAKKLAKGKSLKFGSATIKMTSDRTYREFGSNGVVLALWLSKSMRKKLEHPTYEELIIVPWLKDENFEWAKERNANILAA